MVQERPDPAEVVSELRLYLRLHPQSEGNEMVRVEGRVGRLDMRDNRIETEDGSTARMVRVTEGSSVDVITLERNIIHARESRNEAELVRLIIETVGQGVERETLGKRALLALLEVTAAATGLVKSLRYFGIPV